MVFKSGTKQVNLLNFYKNIKKAFTSKKFFENSENWERIENRGK